MSQASDLRAVGNSVLLEKDGEPLSYKRRDGSTVQIVGTVNMDVDVKRDRASKASIDFNAQDVSIIEFPTSAISGEVHTGETFKDSVGNFHRVQHFKHIGPNWRCTCVMA